MPGADPADFFNYGLNINTWKEYVGRIHQFRLEFSMQKKIQTYESSNDTPALDPDLPPELAAAVAQGRQASCCPLLPLASASLSAAVCLLEKLAPGQSGIILGFSPKGAVFSFFSEKLAGRPGSIQVCWVHNLKNA